MITTHQYPPHDDLPPSLRPHPGLVTITVLSLVFTVAPDGQPHLLVFVAGSPGSVLVHPASDWFDRCLLIEEVVDVGPH